MQTSCWDSFYTIYNKCMWLISKTERSLNLRKLVNTGLFQITSQSTKKKKSTHRMFFIWWVLHAISLLSSAKISFCLSESTGCQRLPYFPLQIDNIQNELLHSNLYSFSCLYLDWLSNKIPTDRASTTITYALCSNTNCHILSD